MEEKLIFIDKLSLSCLYEDGFSSASFQGAFLSNDDLEFVEKQGHRCPHLFVSSEQLSTAVVNKLKQVKWQACIGRTDQ